MHHAEQVSAAAARGVADFDPFEGVQNGLGVPQLSGVAVVHKTGGCFAAAGRWGQIVLERFAAHERDDGPRGVVTARFVAPGHQLLEHLAQHLGIDGHFDVERSRFGDGEVVALEEVEDGGEGGVRNFY